MPIINYINLFISSLINLLLYCFVVKKVFNTEITKNKKTFLICLILGSICIAIINIFNKDIFKILLTFPFILITIRSAFDLNYKKSIIYFLISTVYMFIGEIMTSIIFSILPFDYTFIFNNILGTVIGTIIVAIFTIPLLYFKKLTKVVNNIENGLSDNSKIIITILLTLAIGALAYKNTTGTANIINIFMNIIITITLISIIYMYYRENTKAKELSENYNELFNYLDNYEKELVEKRKIIHDYKNQLIVINGYIGDDKKLKEYVSELISEQKAIKENSLINNIDKIPRGLKGLIYYKLSHIDKNIKINIDVLSSLKKFDKLPSKLNKDVLKIIGVLLDNAIEAVENEKDKFINIEFSVKKNKFIMIIENTCSNNINCKDISEIGYSTKGKDRGYGMALVKDILKHQKDIDLELKVENNEFISKLSVLI